MEHYIKMKKDKAISTTSIDRYWNDFQIHKGFINVSQYEFDEYLVEFYLELNKLGYKKSISSFVNMMYESLAKISIDAYNNDSKVQYYVPGLESAQQIARDSIEIFLERKKIKRR